MQVKWLLYSIIKVSTPEYICRVLAISWDGCNEKLPTVSEVQQKRNQTFDVGGLSDYLKLSKIIEMILVLVHGQGRVEKGFNVNKDMLQPNLEGMSLSHSMIYYYLVSNNLSP